MKHAVITTVAILLSACSVPPGNGESAATVFLNASAYTLNPDRPWAEAVVVRGNRIAYVGDNDGAKAFAGEAASFIDLAGKMLLPGFIDTHVHPLGGGGLATALALDTEADIEDWLRSIADYAAANPGDDVLFGYGFMASAFGTAGPTRQQIDAVVADRPVLIIDEGFHSGWVNTAALERLQITQDTPDPVPGFSYYKRDANGDATGFLVEKTMGMAMADLDVLSAQKVSAGTAIIIGIMNGYGVTSIFDAGTPDFSATFVDDVLANLEAHDGLTVRIVGSSRADTVAQVATAASVADAWRESVRGKRYHYNTLKISDDGTIEARTAAMFEDYQGDPGNAGATVFTEAQLVEMMTGAAARDIDVHIHALGERAVHEALNAIDAVRLSKPDSKSRYTICHIQVVADQDVARFAELDVIAQSTPLWATYDTYGKPFVSDDQFQRYFRFKSIAAHGARLSFGSDFPASGAGTLGLSPLVQIELGHTRQYPGEPDAPVQPPESERLSLASLVRGFTLDAAYQLHLEDRIGSVEVGKLADLVILEQNLFEVDPYTIHDIAVVMTMLDGNVVYEADD